MEYFILITLTLTLILSVFGLIVSDIKLKQMYKFRLYLESRYHERDFLINLDVHATIDSFDENPFEKDFSKHIRTKDG